MGSKIIFTLIVSALCAQIALVNSKYVETDQIEELKSSLEQLTQQSEAIKFRVYGELFTSFNTKATDDEILDCLVGLSPELTELIDEAQESFWGCVDKAGDFVIDAILKIMATRAELSEQMEKVKGLILKCKEDNSGDSTAALKCLVDENQAIQEKVDALGEKIMAFVQSARDAIAEGRVCLEDFTEVSIGKYIAWMAKLYACYED